MVLERLLGIEPDVLTWIVRVPVLWAVSLVLFFFFFCHISQCSGLTSDFVPRICAQPCRSGGSGTIYGAGAWTWVGSVHYLLDCFSALSWYHSFFFFQLVKSILLIGEVKSCTQLYTREVAWCGGCSCPGRSSGAVVLEARPGTLACQLHSIRLSHVSPLVLFWGWGGVRLVISYLVVWYTGAIPGFARKQFLVVRCSGDHLHGIWARVGEIRDKRLASCSISPASFMFWTVTGNSQELFVVLMLGRLGWTGDQSGIAVHRGRALMLCTISDLAISFCLL